MVSSFLSAEFGFINQEHEAGRSLVLIGPT